MTKWNPTKKLSQAAFEPHSFLSQEHSTSNSSYPPYLSVLCRNFPHGIGTDLYLA